MMMRNPGLGNSSFRLQEDSTLRRMCDMDRANAAQARSALVQRGRVEVQLDDERGRTARVQGVLLDAESAVEIVLDESESNARALRDLTEPLCRFALVDAPDGWPRELPVRFKDGDRVIGRGTLRADRDERALDQRGDDAAREQRDERPEQIAQRDRDAERCEDRVPDQRGERDDREDRASESQEDRRQRREDRRA